MSDPPDFPDELPWGEVEYVNGKGAPAYVEGESTPEPAEPRRVWTPVERLVEWRNQGPLIHEPTGLAKLDELTDGGPVYGSRWYFVGAPDACKTLFFVQTGDRWCRAGVVVGLLAVDEEADDIVTRLAQRAKFRRSECEVREPATLHEMGEALEGCPLRMYGPEWTIEAAADDLAKYAKSVGEKRIALLVDSIQKVACDMATVPGDREKSPREVVNANVRALREVATRHRLIAMATGEMNRNAYRSAEAAAVSNDMAAAKESGDIEYSARVLVSLRSVEGEADLIEMRIVKNKHGPSYPRQPELYLRLERHRQTLEETDGPPKPTAEDERRGNAQDVAKDAAALLPIIVANAGVGRRQLEAKAKASGLKWGVRRFDATIEHLTESGDVDDREITRGNVTYHHYHAHAVSHAADTPTHA